MFRFDRKVKYTVFLSFLGALLYAQQPSYTLQTSESGTAKQYTARDFVSLKPGFSYKAESGDKSFNAKIDAGLLFPPTDKTYKMADGSFTADPTQGTVVGSIPGQFAVSPTGAATYTIPIEVPAGINGMQPKISLDYNSQGGNGIAGWGWNIGGLSMISRVPKNYYYDKETNGIIWDNTSPLALDGQRLIEIQRWGTDSVEFDTEVKSGNRIVGINIKEWGAEYFKVYTKSGQIIQYGNPDNIASYYPIEGYYQKTATNQFVNMGWCIANVTDNNKNTIHYYYTNEASEYTELGECLESYDDEYGTWCARYEEIPRINYRNNILDKIGYGGNSIINNIDNIDIKFEYENDLTEDIIESYLDGKNTTVTKVLRKVNVLVEAQSQYTYSIDYDIDEKKHRLRTVTLNNNYSQKINSADFVWSNNSYNYTQQGEYVLNYYLSQKVSKFIEDGYSNSIAIPNTSWGDIDGDGDDDVIRAYRLEKKYYASYWDRIWGNFSYDYKYVLVLYQNQNGYFSCIYDSEYNSRGEDRYNTFSFIDKNADGKEELYCGGPYNNQRTLSVDYIIDCYEYNNGLISENTNSRLEIAYSDYVSNEVTAISADFLGNGEVQFMTYARNNNNGSMKLGGFSEGNVVIDNISSFPKFSDIYVTDFNRNGKSELVQVYDNLKIYELTKKNSSTSQSISYELKLIYTYYGINNSDKCYTGDFNGDGNTDLLVFDYSDKRWRLLISTGSNFVEKFCTIGLTESSLIKVIDINKDGKSDILSREDNFINGVSIQSNIVVLLSTGNSFSKVLSTPYTGKHCLLGETCRINSDKYEDIISISDRHYIEIFNVSNNLQFNKIVAVKDKSNNVTDIGYDLYVTNNLKAFNPEIEGANNENSEIRTYSINRGNWDVVNRVKYLSSNQNLIEHTLYNYGDAKIHKQGKGLLGYDSFKVTNNFTGVEKRTEYKLNVTYNVLIPYRETVSDINSNSNKINESVSEYIFEGGTDNNIRYTLKLDYLWEKDYLSSIETKTEYTAYDNWLNPTDIKTTKGSIIENQHISYVQKGSWCPNKPDSVRSTITYNNESIVRKKAYGYDNNGNLTSETTNPDDNKFSTVTEYKNFDAFGHPETITLKAKDKNGIEYARTTTQKYKPGGRFVDYKINLLGEKTTYAYDESRGLLMSETTTDKNNRWSNVTSYTYDSWDNLQETVYPDGIRKTQVLQWAGSGSPEGALYYSYSQASGSAPVYVWYDDLGREIQKDTYGLNNKKISVKTEYYTTGTNIGKLYRVSEPYFSNETPKWAAKYTVYDPYGRGATTVVTPTGTTTTAYSGLTTTVTTPEGTKSTTLNSSGLVASTSVNGKTVSYTYYPNGLTKTSTPEGGTALAMEYNIQGKRTKLTDPDAGIIETVYNGFGELEEEKQLVHKNTTTPIVTTNNYDYTTGLLNSINRNGELTEYTYDTDLGYKSRVKSIKIASDRHKQEFTYDNHNRVTNIKESLKESNGTKVFNRGTECDALGRVKKETYPSGYYTVNTYDTNSNLIGIKDKNNRQLWEAVAENARGQLTDAKKGGRLIEYRFDDRGLPTSIKSANIVDLEYNFDDDLNLEYRIEKHKTLSGIDVTHREDFKYDDLDRLYEWGITQTGATTAAKTSNIVYNPTTGTITSKSDLGGFSFGYGEGNGKPHALTSISGVPASFPQPTDAYQLANLDVTYTDFKKIKTLSEMGKTYELTYGVDDQRRKSVYKENGVTKLTRYYVGDYEEEVDALGNVKQIHYLSGAMLIRANGVETLYYSYADYQGSLIALTNESGAVVERYAYDPWGARRNADNWTEKDSRTTWIVNRGYTGHEHLDAFGIINMNGRVYDPLTAMFFSPDPYVQAPDNWLNYNRYGYCYGNPFKYTDPSGNLQIGPFYLSFNIGFSANGGFSFGISAGIGIENHASLGISINYSTNNKSFSFAANAGFGGGYAYAGFDTKGGFVAGTGYSVASLTSAFSPVTINTNMLSVGADYSSNGGFSGNYFGASISKAGMSFNPSVGASLNFVWSDTFYNYIADGQEITNYENSIYETQEAVDELTREYGIKAKVYYKDENEKLKGGYKRDAGGKLYNDEGKLIGGTVLYSLRGLKASATIHMSPYKSFEAFAITLNHELIHYHHINNFSEVRYIEGSAGFNQLTEYGAYSYSQLYYRKNIIPSEFVPSQSMLNRNIMHLSYPTNLIPIASDRYGRVIY